MRDPWLVGVSALLVFRSFEQSHVQSLILLRLKNKYFKNKTNIIKIDLKAYLLSLLSGLKYSETLKIRGDN